jgi:hypothetical protein
MIGDAFEVQEMGLDEGRKVGDFVKMSHDRFQLLLLHAHLTRFVQVSKGDDVPHPAVRANDSK